MDDIKTAAKALVAQMTPEEKAQLCSGADFWNLKGLQRLGIDGVCITDGPHGLRKQATQSSAVQLSQSVPTTCFPAACATACSFDPALLEEMGEAMGEECLAEEVAVILGPGANMKRSPLCGRNFEYFSEDPLLAGKCAAGLIRGVERTNVGTSLKHFAGNNQETLRMVSDSRIDERALREIYLTAFETAVKEGRPATVMCSYNKLNGVYASDNRRLLTDILRREWGFDGLVMTDWGAMNDCVAALEAGLDLQMPGPCPGEEAQILRAVRDGRLTMDALDAAAVRVVRVLLRGAQNETQPYDAQAHHALAGKIAEQSAVLLQNDGTLPFSKTANVLLTGGFARAPRYQGAGSSQIVPTRLTSALDAFETARVPFVYAEGFEPEELLPDAAKIAEAVAAAQRCDAVCVFAGLPASYESEGFDREHLSLPKSQLALIEALCATGKPVCVVLSCGSCVEVPFADSVNAILLMNLSGQNSGTAAQHLLYGDANPCGKLAQTWPMRLSDAGNTAFFGTRQAQYRESIYIGYRWYDKAQLPVRWPFGHGLSYTSFAYSALRLSAQTYHSERSAALTVTFTVKNAGSVPGSEIAQVYVSAPADGPLFMPVRELRGFAKVTLAPGESKTVRLQLDKRAFAYYNAPAACWHVMDGTYQ
ncbi:MAG: glycoside hydrolase family 3 C-terminal domain-containing protein, partial [Ruthenibacterium sp.]